VLTVVAPGLNASMRSQLAPGASTVPVVVLLTHGVPVARTAKSDEATARRRNRGVVDTEVILPDVTPPTLVIVYLMGADVSPRRTVPKSRAILVAGVNSRSHQSSPCQLPLRSPSVRCCR